MKNSPENQRENRILSACFSPGSKAKTFHIPHYNPAFALETPMKPSQIPNRLPYHAHRRPLPLQSLEQDHRHRARFGISPHHPPLPPERRGPPGRRSAANDTHKPPQQHFPRAPPPRGPVLPRHPVTPPPHLRPAVDRVNHTSRDLALPERDPPQGSTDARLAPADTPQDKVESGAVEAAPVTEPVEPGGRVPRQRCDSWSPSSRGAALPPVTEQARRASFPLQHTSTEDQKQEVTARHASNTSDTPQKRRRESGGDGDTAKKQCLLSVHRDKTVTCAAPDVLSPHGLLPALERCQKTPEKHPRTEAHHAKSAENAPSPTHRPKRGVRQVWVKSSHNNVLILSSPSKKRELVTRTHEQAQKKDVPPMSSPHGINVPKGLHRAPQVSDGDTDWNCNRPPVSRASAGSSRRPQRSKKPPDDLNDLFTPDPVQVGGGGVKRELKVRPDEECDAGSSSRSGQSPVSSQAQTLVSKAWRQENMHTPSISSTAASSALVTYINDIRISLPTVRVLRLVLPLKTEKDAARSGASSEAVKDSLDSDLDLDLDLDARTISSSDSEDEPLVSLQEIMKRKKPPDTPEEGAFSEPSTPGSDSRKRPHRTSFAAKTTNYKNNLDQMLQEITTSKKAREVETELLTACQEDLLRIAEFEEAELSKEEPLSAEHQQILQRYSLMTSAIREVPPGHHVFKLERFGHLFHQNSLQLRQCSLHPQETTQKTLLWSSHAQFKLYVRIGLFQEAYERSPCPPQITRFLFKMMCVHSDAMLSLEVLQVLTDLAYVAATQALGGSRSFRVWVPSLADVTLVLMNMGVPFVSLFPLEFLQPPFTEEDLIENVYIKSENPSRQTQSRAFPEHNCNNMFKYLDCCLGLCPRCFSDGELLLLLVALCTVSLETRLILQASVELEPLLYKLLNNIRRWDHTMPKICVALAELTDNHHNMCHLVQLLPEHARGKNLRRHLSLSMISRLLPGSRVYRATAHEPQLSELRPYVRRMTPSLLLRSIPRSSQHAEEERDSERLDQQAYYLCYSLLTLMNEATSVQSLPDHQKEQLLVLSSELERHVKCHIRESEKCLYRSKVKDLVARIYTKWQMLVQKTRPLNGKLYDYWQPLRGDAGGSQDIEEIESSQECWEKEDTGEMREDGAKMEDEDDVILDEEESESTWSMRPAEGLDYRDQFVAKDEVIVEEEKTKCTFQMETEGGACSQGPVSSSPVSRPQGPVSCPQGPVSSSQGPVSSSPVSCSQGPVSCPQGPVSSQCGDMQRLLGAPALLTLIHS